MKRTAQMIDRNEAMRHADWRPMSISRSLHVASGSHKRDPFRTACYINIIETFWLSGQTASSRSSHVLKAPESYNPKPTLRSQSKVSCKSRRENQPLEPQSGLVPLERNAIVVGCTLRRSVYGYRKDTAASAPLPSVRAHRGRLIFASLCRTIGMSTFML